MREMQADRYYGSTARDYDMKRSHKPCWQREQDAVKEFVMKGPVLDVPVGTGRYIQIYKDKRLAFKGFDASDEMIGQAKMKHPDLEAERGTIANLTFKDREFGTVVCSRLLNWLYPVDMAKAVQEIRRVGKEVVMSIRLGEGGLHDNQGNYTHTHEDFYAAIDGLLIVGYKWILSAADGEFGMFHLRKPTWEDVFAQFKWHKDKNAAVTRLTNDWATIYGLKFIDLGKGRIRAEQWTHDRLRYLINEMALQKRPDGKPNAMLTDEKPNSEEGFLTIIRTQGREFMIDGRRRANMWMGKPGHYQVVAIDVSED